MELIEDILDRFSCSNFKSTVLQKTIPLAKGEIQVVKKRMIIISQKVGYPNEYKKWSNQENLSSDCQLLSFNPLIDAKGIMRVSGHLVSTPDMSYDEGHPIILPYKFNCSDC